MKRRWILLAALIITSSILYINFANRYSLWTYGVMNESLRPIHDFTFRNFTQKAGTIPEVPVTPPSVLATGTEFTLLGEVISERVNPMWHLEVQYRTMDGRFHSQYLFFPLPFYLNHLYADKGKFILFVIEDDENVHIKLDPNS